MDEAEWMVHPHQEELIDQMETKTTKNSSLIENKISEAVAVDEAEKTTEDEEDMASINRIKKEVIAVEVKMNHTVVIEVIVVEEASAAEKKEVIIQKDKIYLAAEVKEVATVAEATADLEVAEDTMTKKKVATISSSETKTP